jgi:hypothetical protein
MIAAMFFLRLMMLAAVFWLVLSRAAGAADNRDWEYRGGGWVKDFAWAYPAKPAAGPVFVIRSERGGRIDMHWQRFGHLAEDGASVEILGECSSACTLVLGRILKDKVCFGPDGWLGFHQARN